ncbi:MAG: hypothetical protein R3A13_10215 [Bdellovibrionota bacterium]
MSDETDATPQENPSIIDSLNPSDFDGHTSILEMSPEQRLMWLSQASLFIYETREKSS